MEVVPAPLDQKNFRAIQQLWSLAKPILTTYIGRELYTRVKRWVSKPREQIGRRSDQML
jgi:hypothetical protein